MSLPRLTLVTRFGDGRSPRKSFTAVSALVHLLVVAGIVFLPTFGSKEVPEDIFFVRVAPGLPGPKTPEVTAPPAKPAPEPAETELPEGARLETKVPEPQKTKKKPKKQPEKPPEKPKPQRAADPPPVQSPAPGEASEPPTVGPGTGGDIASADLGDVELAWYRDRVIASLKSHWRQPVLEGLGQSLSVTLSFEILRDGSVRKLQIESSSGVPSLDRSAMRAVIEAAPLPPLPPTWRESAMSARFVFTWYP